MKNFLLFVFLLPLFSSSQGIDNLWMMGYGGGIDTPYGGINMNFISGSLTITHQVREVSFLTTSATICNGNGDPLFCSNGIFIADASGDTMLNGSGLSPASYTTSDPNGLFIPQAVLILPDPEATDKYNLFHLTIDTIVDGLRVFAYRFYYSVVDMTLNGGLGGVTSKNNIIVNDTLMPRGISAVKHGNGRDWWLTFHQGSSDLYYIYLIDPTGIHFHATQHIGSTLFYAAGQACFSPDGTKFAMYSPHSSLPSDLDIFDFDRCSGYFSNPIHVVITGSNPGGGVAFSPNSKVLYVSSALYVYQFDLTSSDVAATQTLVAAWDGYYSPTPPFATTFYLSQLAPDGKIYISCGNGTLDIHVIDFPDSLGTACNVCQHCIHLPAYNAFTMPNHPNYHLGAESGSVCDSLVNITNIEQGAGNVEVFPNPSSGIFNLKLKDRSDYISSAVVEDILGNEISINRNLSSIDLNNHPSGIYFVHVQTRNGKAFAVKLIKE